MINFTDEYLTYPANHTAEELLRRLQENKRTYFVRVGDGEIIMLENDHHRTKTQNGSKPLAYDLRDAVGIVHDDYMLAIGCGINMCEYDNKLRHNKELEYVTRQVIARHIKPRMLSNPHALTAKFLWHPEWFKKYCELLAARKPLFIGGKNFCISDKLMNFFGVREYIEFPDAQSYPSIHDRYPEISSKLGNYDCVVEIIGSAGKILAYKMWQDGWDGYYLDVGSLMNGMLRQPVRGWIRDYVTEELLEYYAL